MKVEMETKSWITEISNYNIPKDCCVEGYCSERATHFMGFDYNGLFIHVMLCEEHKSKLEDLLYEQIRSSNQKVKT